MSNIARPTLRDTSRVSPRMARASRPTGLGLATLGLASALLAGCDRLPDTSTGAPPPPTTVGTVIDDNVISTRVRSALLADPQVKSFDVKVDTRKGEVMLSGYVDNQAQVDRAVELARGIEGVQGVDNRMDLKTSRTSVGNKVDDAIVTARVKATLLADALVKGLDITVVTRKGEVQLSGFVDNPGQMNRAAALTREVDGVASVNNQMSVKK